MADKKAGADTPPKKAWWIDQSSVFSGGITWGDEMPGKVTQSRLDELHKLEKISYTEPEEKEDVTASQVDKLRSFVIKLQDEKKELEAIIEKTPKGVTSAKTELKKVKAELDELKQARTKVEGSKAGEIVILKADAKKSAADVKYLTDMISEMEKTWVDPKDGK